MKPLKLSFLILISICLFSCKEKSRLTKEYASATIMQFMSRSSIASQGGMSLDGGNVQVNQFNEDEATCTVPIKLREDMLTIDFAFKRNIEDKWVVTAVKRYIITCATLDVVCYRYTIKD
jgi:hypothetical protein